RSARTLQLLIALLIRPDELGLLEDVALHRLLELRLRGVAEIGQDRVEGIELVEVTVSADGRTRTAVARPLPVVHALLRSGRQRARGDRLGQAGRGGGQVV